MVLDIEIIWIWRITTCVSYHDTNHPFHLRRESLKISAKYIDNSSQAMPREHERYEVSTRYRNVKQFYQASLQHYLLLTFWKRACGFQKHPHATTAISFLRFFGFKESKVQPSVAEESSTLARFLSFLKNILLPLAATQNRCRSIFLVSAFSVTPLSCLLAILARYARTE